MQKDPIFQKTIGGVKLNPITPEVQISADNLSTAASLACSGMKPMEQSTSIRVVIQPCNFPGGFCSFPETEVIGLSAGSARLEALVAPPSGERSIEGSCERSISLGRPPYGFTPHIE
ncbi:hypothetical protein EYZ11_007323 [Aspergillus tanneri]|uniref:Uncharacterized protein n=1 Tax=Aspergillus tanneri TaxID=1220188 RepID=A0A4S3JD88_9EURO|nr:hypothetical protein EYZ11_007323 [Aspergillus tanneri]